MRYKKIENEVDRLLESDGLNFYERKLLRKVKRKLCSDNEDLRAARWKIQQCETRWQRLYKGNGELLDKNSNLRIENLILRKLMNVYRWSTVVFILAFFGCLIRLLARG